MWYMEDDSKRQCIDALEREIERAGRRREAYLKRGKLEAAQAYDTRLACLKAALQNWKSGTVGREDLEEAQTAMFFAGGPYDLREKLIAEIVRKDTNNGW